MFAFLAYDVRLRLKTCSFIAIFAELTRKLRVKLVNQLRLFAVSPVGM